MQLRVVQRNFSKVLEEFSASIFRDEMYAVKVTSNG
jgi:hypothetical protein